MPFVVTHPLLLVITARYILYFSCDIVFQAHILYDFEGDAENDELNLKEGDIVTILNQVLKTTLSSIDRTIRLSPLHTTTFSSVVSLLIATIVAFVIGPEALASFEFGEGSF